MSEFHNRLCCLCLFMVGLQYEEGQVFYSAFVNMSAALCSIHLMPVYNIYALCPKVDRADGKLSIKLKLSQDMIVYLFPPRSHAFTCLLSSHFKGIRAADALWETNPPLVEDEDYRHNSRTLTQNGWAMGHYMAQLPAWHDGFPSVRWGRMELLLCTEEFLQLSHINAFYGGVWWRACFYNSEHAVWLLMDLCIEFCGACVLMHMMCSYMSQWATGPNSTRRF